MSHEQVAREVLVKFYINGKGFIASALEGVNEVRRIEYVVPTLILNAPKRLLIAWDFYYNNYYYNLRKDIVQFYDIRIWENGHLRKVDIKFDEIGV